MKSVYSSSPVASSSFPNPSKYFGSDSSKSLLSIKAPSNSAKVSSEKTNSYVQSPLPGSLFRPDSASAAVSSSSSNSANNNGSRPSSSGSQRSSILTSISGSGKGNSQFPPTAPRSLFGSSTTSTVGMTGNGSGGSFLSGSPPVGPMLTRDRRSSSCNDAAMFRENLDFNSALSAVRTSNSTGSPSMTMNGSSSSAAKKVRFAVNLVSYAPQVPNYVPGSPVLSCVKGSAAAAAHAATMARINNSSNNNSSTGTGGNNGNVAGSGTSSPATQSPPTLLGKEKDGNISSGGAGGIASINSGKHGNKTQMLVDINLRDNGNTTDISSDISGASADSNLGDHSSGTGTGFASASGRDRASPLLTAGTIAGGAGGGSGGGGNSSRLVPVHMSPKPTPKKLLLEKQPSGTASGLMMSIPSIAAGSGSGSSSSSSSSSSQRGSTSSPLLTNEAGTATGTGVGSSASVSSNGNSTEPSPETPVAALIAKSVSISNFVSNNQTSARFYSSRVEFSVSTHPQLFDKASMSQASQPLTVVSLQYADMTGISIAGTKLRFKIHRKCTPFSASFEADAQLIQVAIDLNSVVSSSIVKQKVMPLICPMMFGGGGGGGSSSPVPSSSSGAVSR